MKPCTGSDVISAVLLSSWDLMSDGSCHLGSFAHVVEISVQIIKRKNINAYILNDRWIF